MLLDSVKLFFDSQLFCMALVIWALDWLTGLFKSVSLGHFAWNKFLCAVYKLPLYVVIYSATHAFSLASEVTAAEQFAILTLCSKELISMFQNLKALAIAHNQDTQMLDALINFLRLNTWQTYLDNVTPKTNRETP